MSAVVDSIEDRMVAAYRDIGEKRMRDLPFYNARLEVEAVSFRAWHGHLIGVLIAPWFMNLVLLPGPDDDWSHCHDGEVREWHLPSGKYRFASVALDGVGTLFSAALFTTVEGFPDQATARAVATETMAQIFVDRGDLGSVGDEDIVAGADVLRRPVSRRGLLRKLALKQD